MDPTAMKRAGDFWQGLQIVTEGTGLSLAEAQDPQEERARGRCEY